MELTITDAKRSSVGILKISFGYNMSIYKGAMEPEIVVTFLAPTPGPVSILSPTIQSKKISISVIALFDY